MFFRSLGLLWACALVNGCVQDADSDEASIGTPAPPDAALQPIEALGSPASLDVMTWNLEQFPTAGEATVTKVAEVIQAIGPDIVAVQEVADADAFARLASSMPGWDGDVLAFYDPASGYNPPVGMLWDTSTVQVLDRYLLFEEDSLAFPRSPMVLEIKWRDVSLVVINVHLKALGDDSIDESNAWDEEVRRLRACERLEQHLYENMNDDRVIVLGDFNDRLEEPAETNVFAEFLRWPGSYLFADMPTAVADVATVSYPKSGSHIDHVLISNELYMAYFREASYARAVTVDRSLEGGFYTYERVLSDHRPVLLRLDMGP